MDHFYWQKRGRATVSKGTITLPVTRSSTTGTIRRFRAAGSAIKRRTFVMGALRKSKLKAPHAPHRHNMKWICLHNSCLCRLEDEGSVAAERRKCRRCSDASSLMLIHRHECFCHNGRPRHCSISDGITLLQAYSLFAFCIHELNLRSEISHLVFLLRGLKQLPLCSGKGLD